MARRTVAQAAAEAAVEAAVVETPADAVASSAGGVGDTGTVDATGGGHAPATDVDVSPAGQVSDGAAVEAAAPEGDTTVDEDVDDTAQDDGTAVGEGNQNVDEDSDAAPGGRAAALAALAYGTGTPDGEHGETDAPALPDATGVVHEWGGDVAHLVVFHRYRHRVDGVTRHASKGDVVMLLHSEGWRGVELGALVELGD